ncbi:Uncharacterised protein [Leclercia adecarboxylata]|uniref:Osmoprotectant uptake system permease protein yehW n=1 Tax=Leclercia adecarboxylata TaxID=83655 RepID=A0A4V6JIB6_9ENTR|nr:Uncharacterised protein [Leclercia adecarboxylata]
MHPLFKRSLLFVGAIIVVVALLVWGIGLETIKARQVDLVYLGQQHLILVFSSMFFALLVGIPSGILLSRPARAVSPNTSCRSLTWGIPCRHWPFWRWRWW